MLHANTDARHANMTEGHSQCKLMWLMLVFADQKLLRSK